LTSELINLTNHYFLVNLKLQNIHNLEEEKWRKEMIK